MVSVGRPELPNLYGLSDTDQTGTFLSSILKKRVYPTIGAGTGMFPAIGQSRIANNSAAGSAAYTCTNVGKALCLNPYDGCYYTADDPVLGCSANSGPQVGWLGRLADKLITAGKYTQVIVIPLAMAGSLVADWDTGGAYHDRIRAVSALLTGMGLTPTAWLWQQGTADSIAGTSQSAYQTSLRSVISYQRGLSGRSSDKWMIAQDTINGAGNSTSSAVRAAQAAVAGDSNNFLGPDCDTLTQPTNSDGTHFNATGNDANAGLWSTKIQAAF